MMEFEREHKTAPYRCPGTNSPHFFSKQVLLFEGEDAPGTAACPFPEHKYRAKLVKKAGKIEIPKDLVIEELFRE